MKNFFTIGASQNDSGMTGSEEIMSGRMNLHREPTTCFRSSSLALLALVLAVATIGCTPANNDEKSTHAYTLGYEEGRADGKKAESDNFKNGYNKGYVAGYEAVRPGAGSRLDSPGTAVAITIALFGFLKIAAVIAWFTGTLIRRSSSNYELSAKILATALAFIVLFWFENSLSVGFSTTLDDVLFRGAMPARDGKIFWGMAGAIGAYSLFGSARLLIRFTRNKPAYETFCVFSASFILAIVLHFGVALVLVPNLNRYLFSDIMIGVTIGGLFYIIKSKIQAAAGDGDLNERLEVVDKSNATGR